MRDARALPALPAERAFVFASAVAVLSAGGHVLAGGHVSVAGVATVAALGWLVHRVGFGRRRGDALERMAALLSLQAGYHLVLAGPGHAHGADVRDQLLAAGQQSVSPSAAMLAGHVLAAVVSGWLLDRAESSAWALAALTQRVRLHVPPVMRLRPPEPPAAPRQVPERGCLSRARAIELSRARARRGPPVGLLAS